MIRLTSHLNEREKKITCHKNNKCILVLPNSFRINVEMMRYKFYSFQNILVLNLGNNWFPHFIFFSPLSLMLQFPLIPNVKILNYVTGAICGINVPNESKWIQNYLNARSLGPVRHNKNIFVLELSQIGEDRQCSL